MQSSACFICIPGKENGYNNTGPISLDWAAAFTYVSICPIWAFEFEIPNHTSTGL